MVRILSYKFSKAALGLLLLVGFTPTTSFAIQDAVIRPTNTTAVRAVATDSNKVLVSIANFCDWIAGTSSRLTCTDDLDGTITLNVDETGLDHGLFLGLADDDHTQYLLLAGRNGGQIVYGGTGAGDILELNSTSHATKGYVKVNGDLLIDPGSPGGNDYKFTSCGTKCLTIQNNIAAENSHIRIMSKDGDGTDDILFSLYGVGTPGATTNRERVILGWDSGDSHYHLITENAGTGTLRPLFLGNIDYQHILGLYTDGTARIGDSEGSDYTAIAADGSVSLHGAARKKMEVVLNARGAKKGASAPTEALRAIGASGGVQVPVDQYSETIQADAYFEAHIPSNADGSVDVAFHLMWMPGSGWTTGNYMWKVEYLVKTEDGDITTGTPTTISADITPADATHFIETHFATTIDAGPQETIVCHFYRDVANDNANDTGDVRFFEVEYTVNSLGE